MKTVMYSGGGQPCIWINGMQGVIWDIRSTFVYPFRDEVEPGIDSWMTDGRISEGYIP